MSKKIKTVRAIFNSIKRTLEREGAYSPSFDMAIEDLAEVTHLKKIALQDATQGYTQGASSRSDDEDIRDVLRPEDRGGRSVTYEYSREGDRRYKVNPAFTMYLELARESQRILSELCMTAKSSKALQDDLLDELDKQIAAANND